MLKTTFKIFMLFVLVTFVAVGTGFATYTITKNIMEEKSAVLTETASVPDRYPVESEDARESMASSHDEPQPFEYYLVRLEGDLLDVYVSHGGKEEFLYNKEVYKNDLSQEDTKMLIAGVKLKSASELTGFIENFTS